MQPYLLTVAGYSIGVEFVFFGLLCVLETCAACHELLLDVVVHALVNMNTS